MIKSGVCEIISLKTPLLLAQDFKQVGVVQQKFTGESVYLGGHSGYMCEPFRKFFFSEISVGNWVGEDSLFNNFNSVNYTVHAKTNLTVLEISTNDLKHLLNKEYINYM